MTTEQEQRVDYKCDNCGQPSDYFVEVHRFRDSGKGYPMKFEDENKSGGLYICLRCVGAQS